MPEPALDELARRRDQPLEQCVVGRREWVRPGLQPSLDIGQRGEITEGHHSPSLFEKNRFTTEAQRARRRVGFPAKAGIHLSEGRAAEWWVPAFAGTRGGVAEGYAP